MTNFKFQKKKKTDKGSKRVILTPNDGNLPVNLVVTLEFS